MFYRQCLFAGLASLAATGAAAAQDIHGFERDPQRDMRASVGISIPFGGSNRQAANMQPRFDFHIETGDSDWHSRAQNLADPRNDAHRNVRRSQFSLTFEDEPRFLVNGAAPLEIAALRAGQDGDPDDQPQGTGDGPNGGDDVDEPDAIDHIARGALFTGAVVATGVAVIVGAFVLSDNDEN
ncbi:hypothetical protein [Aurantiacibacter sediminis]|uniref:Secreted protein n=1 Tax=Aurantiacibacter sediminis TaxID=2793064 RepID=A0ABS0N2T2_9SPHN|nr:hypothetical protein [Aurantiacibacter sediminis]MBH5322267.1 hypothetical protein [Aurantiacibacter sediminis]